MSAHSTKKMSIKRRANREATPRRKTRTAPLPRLRVQTVPTTQPRRILPSLPRDPPRDDRISRIYPPLRSYICGKGIKTKEDALEEFWRFQNKYKGKRRGDQRKVVKILSVRHQQSKHGGGFWISYQIPWRIRKEWLECPKP